MLKQWVWDKKKSPNISLRVFFFLCVCGAFTSGHVASPQTSITHPVRLLWRKQTSFASSCQLEISSWLGMGYHVHFRLLVLGPYLAWPCEGPMHAVTYVFIHMCICPFFVWITQSPWCLPSPLVLTNFCLLWHSSLSPEGRSLMKKSHSGLSVSRIQLWTQSWRIERE